ncbi:MAG: hypothetical protein KAR19_18780 [Bacteroidales bacterium]|nr:hypothetical protein [Bacteroidales bacterium]
MKKGIRETYCDVCKHIVVVLMYVIHDGTEAILELQKYCPYIHSLKRTGFADMMIRLNHRRGFPEAAIWWTPGEKSRNSMPGQISFIRKKPLPLLLGEFNRF